MSLETIELSSEDSDQSDYESGLKEAETPPTIALEDVKFPCSSTSDYRISNDTIEKNIKKETDGDTSISPIGINNGSEKKTTGRKKRRRSDASSEGKKITAAERQALKKKMIEDKRAAKSANKIFKPGECMKHMTVEMHPVLLESWFCGDVQREVHAGGAKIKTSSAMCDTAFVLWSRGVPTTLTNVGGLVELTPSKQRCSHGLYIHTAEDIDSYVTSRTLAGHVMRAKELAGCDLTLVVFGVKDYFKSSGRKTTNSRQKAMKEMDLETAITDLLVSANCDTIIVNTPNELALTIAQFTKAIAEEPYKKAKRALDEKADFYMRGDNKKCVAVDKDGNGLSRLWQQMIAILPLSSLETSRALCAQYKTPLELYEALQSPSGITDLADLGVSRAAVPGSKARRIGPEFARKLHILFTAEDGNVLLD